MDTTQETTEDRNTWRHIPDMCTTARTRARYSRLAPLYDRLESRADAKRFSYWRAQLWERVRGPRVLEMGVGTGRNFPYYRPDWQITAVDLTPAMLARAQERACREHVAVHLELADAQALPFPDACFETVVATFVFCSVPDPVLGLREAYRVLVPGGQLLLLEHVLSERRLVRPLMRVANPLIVCLSGANIDRETVTNVSSAGFDIGEATNLWGDIVKRMEAQRPMPASARTGAIMSEASGGAHPALSQCPQTFRVDIEH